MKAWELSTRLGTAIQANRGWRTGLRFLERTLPARARARDGQALVETVMTTGFLVALALVLDKSLIPIVVKAFDHIAKALSSVGP
jgi:hypothetical protein